MSEQALNDAAGRKLAPDELRGIQQRALDAVRFLRRVMPHTWAGMSPTQQARAAGELAQARYADLLRSEQQRTVERMAGQARR